MTRWLKQLWCAHRGHHYPTITVPIVAGLESPETNTTYCGNCGAELYTEFTDNAGTERRS